MIKAATTAKKASLSTTAAKAKHCKMSRAMLLRRGLVQNKLKKKKEKAKMNSIVTLYNSYKVGKPVTRYRGEFGDISVSFYVLALTLYGPNSFFGRFSGHNLR